MKHRTATLAVMLLLLVIFMITAPMMQGGVDTGWTFYTPYSTAASNTSVIPTPHFLYPLQSGDEIAVGHGEVARVDSGEVHYER